MLGTLIVWGEDSEGFWKMRISCTQSEVSDKLAELSDYEDHDFEF